MYSHTDKVGSLGRYGPRVGRKLRNEAHKIELESRKGRGCPSCGRRRLKRVGGGIWSCRTCSFTFAGGAHIPVLKHVALEHEVNQE
jgi:large subunit ribosomal protein L37Ae